MIWTLLWIAAAMQRPDAACAGGADTCASDPRISLADPPGSFAEGERSPPSSWLPSWPRGKDVVERLRALKARVTGPARQHARRGDKRDATVPFTDPEICKAGSAGSLPNDLWRQPKEATDQTRGGGVSFDDHLGAIDGKPCVYRRYTFKRDAAQTELRDGFCGAHGEHQLRNVRDLDFPTTFFHGSPDEYAATIEDEGLQPNPGGSMNQNAHNVVGGAVYFASSMRHARAYAQKDNASCGSIFEVELCAWPGAEGRCRGATTVAGGQTDDPGGIYCSGDPASGVYAAQCAAQIFPVAVWRGTAEDPASAEVRDLPPLPTRQGRIGRGGGGGGLLPGFGGDDEEDAAGGGSLSGFGDDDGGGD